MKSSLSDAINQVLRPAARRRVSTADRGNQPVTPLGVRKQTTCLSSVFVVFSLSFFVSGVGTAVFAATGCDGAGNCYVRAGATGSKNGANWVNAYTDLPSSLTRGATYWVAGGTYGPHKFNDPDSGTTAITIKAPTSGNHGTSMGWSDSYATQATWKCTGACQSGTVPIWDLSWTDYYVIDGSYCTPMTAYPNVCSLGYGFHTFCNGYCGEGNTGNNCVQCGGILIGSGPYQAGQPHAYTHDISIKYVEVEGNYQSKDTGLADAGIYNVGGSYNLYYGHNYLHHNTWQFFMRGNHAGQSGYGAGSNITVEYSFLYWDYAGGSPNAPHGTPFDESEGIQNYTVRYNLISDMGGNGATGGTSYGPDTASGADYNNGNGYGGPWYIYGNIWYADTNQKCAVGDGVLAIYDFSMTNGNVWFVNNTIANEGYPFCGTNTDEVTYGIGIGYTTPMHGWYEQNNLWYLADLSQYNGSDIIQNGVTSGGTQGGGATFNPATVHGYDAYFSSPNTGANDNDTHKQVSGTNPFVSVSGNDFRLASDTTAGVTLTNTGTYWNGTALVANTFNVDMNGTTRGASGVWDRGALQIPSGKGPAPPTNLTATPH